MSARDDRPAALVQQVRRLAARISDQPVDAWSAENCELLDQAAMRLHRAAMGAALWLASERTAPAEGEDTGDGSPIALRPSEPVDSGPPVNNLEDGAAKPAAAPDLRQEPMADQNHGADLRPHVVPVLPVRDPAPEAELVDVPTAAPEPTVAAPITLTYADMHGGRLHRPGAPAADRDGLVTLDFEGAVIRLPDLLLDSGPYPHGPPLLERYLNADQLREIIATAATRADHEGAAR